MNWKLFLALTGVTLLSLTAIVSVVIWETRTILTRQKGESLEALATSGSQRMEGELARELELLKNLSEESAFFYQVFGSQPDEASSVSNGDRTTLFQQESAWVQGDEVLHLKTRSHPASIHLKRFARKFPAHVQLIYTDHMGVLLASGGHHPEHYVYGEKDWWKQTWNGGQGRIYVRQLPVSSEQPSALIEIAIPVRLLGTQSAQGVLRSRFQINELNVFKDLATLSEIGGVILTNHEGTIIHSSEQSDIGKTVNPKRN